MAEANNRVLPSNIFFTNQPIYVPSDQMMFDLRYVMNDMTKNQSMEGTTMLRVEPCWSLSDHQIYEVQCETAPPISEAIVEIVTESEEVEPDSVDMQNLTSNPATDRKETSDEDDSVVFVKAYTIETSVKTEQLTTPMKPYEIVQLKQEEKENREVGSTSRRNPVRQARNRNNKLKTHHYLEEDLQFLDEMNDKSEIASSKMKCPSPGPSTSRQSESLKEWPVNVFERPAYNANTKEVVPHDIVLKENTINSPPKKAAKSPPTKPKAPYKARKRRGPFGKRQTRAKKVVVRVPVDEMRPAVITTMKMLKEHEKLVGHTRFHSLLQTQTILLAYTHSLDANAVSSTLSSL